MKVFVYRERNITLRILTNQLRNQRLKTASIYPSVNIFKCKSKAIGHMIFESEDLFVYIELVRKDMWK